MIEEDIWEAMGLWIKEQRVPPTQSAVVNAALRDFLDRISPKKRKVSK